MIQTITSQFLDNKAFKSFIELKGGHINKTYLVNTHADKKYILQQINDKVFKDVAKLTCNLQVITTHFQKKINDKGLDDKIQTFLYYPTIKDEKYYYKHTDNSFWRLSDYIENQSIEDAKVNNNIASESGKLFGLFLSLVSDIDLERIYSIIPDFHNTENYFSLLKKAVKKNPVKRLDDSQNILDSILKEQWLLHTYLKVKEDKTIPLRLTHNDTKSTNILYDNMSKAIAIIDLDTCMPGYLMTDFGDSIRSLCNTGKEDDQNLDNITFDIDLFKSYTKGFLSTTNSFILKAEKNNLAVFSLLITYEQAIRFYTDYINGDTYYKTDYKEHNLQRTKAQLRLLEEMIVRFDEMKEIVEAVLS